MSLGIAYWVNGFFLGYLLPGALMIGYSLLNPLRNYLRADALAVMILTAGQLGLWVWVVVGIIRSANRHTEHGGKPFWANAARVFMAISVIAMGIGLHKRIIPEFRLDISLVAGHDPLDPVDVQVSADGRTIIVDGSIGLGSLDRLEKILAASPDATEVLLNSDGGREAEAQLIVDLIKRKHLNTSVRDRCLSACTLAFLAGSERKLSDDAELGFHRSSAVGTTDFQQQLAVQEMKQTYRALGVREWFIERIVATPPEGMWYPTRDELQQAGVL